MDEVYNALMSNEKKRHLASGSRSQVEDLIVRGKKIKTGIVVEI